MKKLCCLKFIGIHVFVIGILICCFYCSFQPNMLFHLSPWWQKNISFTGGSPWYNVQWLGDSFSYIFSIFVSPEKIWILFTILFTITYYFLQRTFLLHTALLFSLSALLCPFYLGNWWGVLFSLFFICALQKYMQTRKTALIFLLFFLAICWTNSDSSSWLGIFALGMFFRKEKKKISFWLLCLALSISYGIFYQRFFIYSFPIWSVAYILGVMSCFYSSTWFEKRKIYVIVALHILSIGIVFVQRQQIQVYTNYKEVATFCQTLPQGNIFHSEELAPWILFYAKRPVFVDSRKERYTPSFLQNIEQAKWNTNIVAEILRTYHCNIICISHIHQDNELLLSWMSQQRNFHLVYADANMFVFLRSDGYDFAEQEKAIFFLADYQEDNSTLKISHNNMKHCKDFQARAKGYILLQKYSEAKHDIEKAQQLCTEPYEWEQKYIESLYLTEQGETEQALSNFLQLQQQANHPKIYQYILKLYLQQGTEFSLQQAKEWCEKTKDLPNSTALLEFYRSQIMHVTGNKKVAKQIIVQSLQKWPYFENARQYLHTLNKEIQIEEKEDRLSQSRLLIQQGKLNEAIQLLKNIIQQDTKFYDAYQSLGELYLQMRRPRESLKYFQYILQHEPNYLLAKTKSVIALAQLGNWRTGEKMLQPLLQTFPDNYAVREALWELDHIAEKSLKQELTTNFSFESIYKLSQILIRRERREEAIQIMIQYESHKTKEMEHGWTSLLCQLYYDEGRVQIQNENVKQGLQYIEKSISLMPHAFEPRFYLGTISLKQKNWQKALECFQYLKELFPLDSRGAQGLSLVELGKGLSLQLQGEYDEALEKFSKFLEKAPEGDEKDSIQKWIENLRKTRRKWEDENYKKLPLLFQEASNFMKQEKWQNAIEIFQKVIEIKSDIPESHLNIGICYTQNNQLDMAETHLANALELRPEWEEAYFHLGLLSYRQDNRVQTIEYFQKFLEKSPLNSKSSFVQKILQSLEK
ncbi:MAG TPA: tetratricopeptide repeat protein [Planctomycetota bacterium]|nr:tetratricopeptide repeat protein [Planctomycetota bacterium]